jgi:hypothetical protein
MGYELMGRAHAALTGLRGQRGQGTVEYVGLVLLLAVVLSGIVAAAHTMTGDSSIAKTIVAKLKDALGNVTDAKAP